MPLPYPYLAQKARQPDKFAASQLKSYVTGNSRDQKVQLALQKGRSSCSCHRSDTAIAERVVLESMGTITPNGCTVITLEHAVTHGSTSCLSYHS
jgi:hypothetical protein